MKNESEMELKNTKIIIENNDIDIDYIIEEKDNEIIIKRKWLK